MGKRGRKPKQGFGSHSGELEVSESEFGHTGKRGRKPGVTVAKAMEGVVPDELRCRRSDGKSWRCSAAAIPGLALCTSHHGRQSKKKKPSSNKGDRANKRAKAVPAEASNLAKRGRKRKQKAKEEKSEAEERDSVPPERNIVERMRVIKEEQEDTDYGSRVRAVPAEAATLVKRGRKRKRKAKEEKSEAEERDSVLSKRNIVKRLRVKKEQEEQADEDEQEDTDYGPRERAVPAEASTLVKRGRKRKRKVKEEKSEAEEEQEKRDNEEDQEKQEDEEDTDYGPRGRGGVRIKREDSGGHVMKKFLPNGLMEIPVVFDAGPDFKKVFDEATDAVISTPKQVDFILPDFHTEQDKRKHVRKATQGIKDEASPLSESPSYRTLNGEEEAQSGVVPDEFRCKRSDGKQWRCSARAMLGRTYCEKHYFQLSKKYQGGITKTHKMKRGHNRKEDRKISRKPPQKEVKKKHRNLMKHKVKDDGADIINSDSEDSQIREKKDHNNNSSIRNEKRKEKVVHKVSKLFDKLKAAVDAPRGVDTNLPKHRNNKANKTDVMKSQNKAIMVGI